MIHSPSLKILDALLVSAARPILGQLLWFHASVWRFCVVFVHYFDEQVCFGARSLTLTSDPGLL